MRKANRFRTRGLQQQRVQPTKNVICQSLARGFRKYPPLLRKTPPGLLVLALIPACCRFYFLSLAMFKDPKNKYMQFKKKKQKTKTNTDINTFKLRMNSYKDQLHAFALIISGLTEIIMERISFDMKRERSCGSIRRRY
jgi:hypothetical protein